MSCPSDTTEVRAEVMRLHYLEGLSMRAIARRLRLSRHTVRRHLNKLPPGQRLPQPPRSCLLDPYDATIRALLEETPELKTPQVLERLRVRGYSGGVRFCAIEFESCAPNPNPRSFSPWISPRAKRCKSTGPTSASHCRVFPGE
jgi:transposase-like protein